MEKPKKDRLARAGWRLGDAADFLELSPEEAADASVSLDLLVKSLLMLGASRGEVGRVIAAAA
jgi:hypothetical protein